MGNQRLRGLRAFLGSTSLAAVASLTIATPVWAQSTPAPTTPPAQTDPPAAIEAAPSSIDATKPAQGEPTSTETTAETPSSDIVVTGSRIARRDYQSNTPIVTIGQGALVGAGQPTLDRAIGQLPQFAAAQGLAQVGDVQARTGFQGGQAYSDLRGLGPNR